ncbi:hypothetical protein DFJ58DRAFT_723228 [Suillus subalutaceus]|uniref:uncharacterized protein n=1 Tax=Suillus subalutaceus TaxID=48586 RepID=UPI001B87F915|nr:uncharacterized protein DFJ58DRAFT_723228 [Suillus subalutaceus]KAG1869380.1 hypothetical protein DFJ58DRAFT_723228 [Suillus subalutaceus]
MKGFLSLVLVSIALLQTAAAAPIVLERSQAVEGEQNIGKRGSFTFGYLACDELDLEVEDVEKRSTNS